ncbi:MAG TPA: TetR family transcriptional regulator [Candidatus Krumholzibacteria bacterium]|nr:TetR family transcriptional regulator [Candidatus Krumholzibacteria bacterium]
MTETSPQPAGRKEREQLRHRRAILDAAVALFAVHGYHQTTMQMIADRAEFSVGFFYKHFKGKEELFQALLELQFQRMDRVLESCRLKDLPPLEAIRHTLEAVCDHFSRHRDFLRMSDLVQEVAPASTRARSVVHVEELRRQLERAKAAGEIQPVDTELLAAAVHGAIAELFRVAGRRGDDASFDLLPSFIFRLMIDPLRA